MVLAFQIAVTTPLGFDGDALQVPTKLVRRQGLLGAPTSTATSSRTNLRAFHPQHPLPLELLRQLAR